MAFKIKLDSDSPKEGPVFSDLHLDLQKTTRPKGGGLLKKSGTKDLLADYDERAIANSIRNIFSTRPGQRLLNPKFGLNFDNYLFEKVSEVNGRFIARKINEILGKTEPRVRLRRTEVLVDEENSAYRINIIVEIPRLNNKVVSFDLDLGAAS